MKKRNIKVVNNSGIKNLINILNTKSKPLINYYLSKTERERQILLIGVGFIVLSILYLMINSIISFGEDIGNSYKTMQSYRADADDLIKRYKYISKLTPNEFSTITVDRIKGDVSQELDIKNPDVQIIDSTLTIKVGKAKFINVMQLFNQLRKSYGIYPDKLKITRLSDSGFVSFNVSFYNVSKDNE